MTDSQPSDSDRGFVFTDEVKYDQELSLESPFPEWIETSRLRFERLTPESVLPKKLYQTFTENEGVDKYFPTTDGLGTTYEDVFEQYTEADEKWENGTFAFYGIFNKESDEFIGFGNFENVDFYKQRAQLGIWLKRSEWGNGYSQERAEAFLEVLFNHLDFELAEVEVIPENEPSIRAVTKYMSEFGGSFDGRIRQITYTPKEDNVYDLYLWSITDEEYHDPDAEYTGPPSIPNQGPD